MGLSDLAGLEDLVDERLLGVEEAEEMKKFSAAVEAEMKKGAMLETTFFCVVGRRAP